MIGIIGSSGFVGKHLMNYFGTQALGISLRKPNKDVHFQKCNILINLVGKAHDHKGDATEEEYFRVNFEMVKDIFASFLASNAKMLIHMSSIAATEELESHLPLTEDDTPNPTSWYGQSKRKAEEWLMGQDLPSGKKLIIIRPPMIHGEGDKGNLGLLYKIVSKGLPYPLGSFDNKRSFISVTNLSFIIGQLIQNKDGIPSGIYHVADDQATSTNEIIRIINRVLGRKPKIWNVPAACIKFIARVGDRFNLFFNSIKLKKMTSDLTVSNEKIKGVLRITDLPSTATEGLEKTIHSFATRKSH